MSILDTRTKGRAGAKAAALAVKNPRRAGRLAKATWPMGKVAFRVARPFAKRRARRQAEGIADSARMITESLLTYAAAAGYRPAAFEPAKSKRTAPRVAAGVALGASAVYFLSPDGGAEHRKKLAQLVG
jgi:hypothetical protein